MGLLDKAMAAAAEAAIRAKETAEELQTKRELGQAYGELGREAFALIERGELASPGLEPVADRIRTLKAQLETPGPTGSTPGAAPTEDEVESASSAE